METDWSPVADLMRRGMAFFHAKEDAIEKLNFNLTQYGLSPDQVLYFYFRWDETAAAVRTGKEVCRLMGGRDQLKVGKIHIGGRNGGLNYREDEAVKSFAEACPETEVVQVWELDSLQKSLYKTTLLFNPLPDVVFCGADLYAQDFLKVAKDVLTPDQYDRIHTTGWGNDIPELLQERMVLTTVDQMVHYPNRGLWKVINNAMNIIQENGLNSTKAVQDLLDMGDVLTIMADTFMISSDRAGYLISNLMVGYEPSFPPYQEVNVSSGLHDVTITKVTPFEGKFEAVLWLRTSWVDPRLVWNPIIYDKNIQLDPKTIWTPTLHFPNVFDFTDLFLSPAVVNYGGEVVMEANLKAEFLCSTGEGLRAFPFETYNCSIDLGASQGVILNQKYGFEVVESDSHFITDTSTVMDEEEFGSTGYYQLVFERRPFTGYVRLVIPALLINMIGFMAFWIPELPESVALGITSLLCSLAFRGTVEMPDTADVTWTEVFMLINVAYQACVLLIIWFSYSKTNVARNMFRRCIYPKKQVAKAEKVPDTIDTDSSAPLNVSPQTADLNNTKEESSGDKDEGLADMDWIGRWFVVPSYIIVMATLLFQGWGFDLN